MLPVAEGKERPLSGSPSRVPPRLLNSMTTVGIIGSGNIGGTVARLAVAAGFEVVVSNSRGPETLGNLVSELGPQVRAATPSEAAAAGSIVLVSVPVKAYPALSGLPVAGKVVMDTGNFYPERDGEIPDLDGRSLTHSQYLARFLPGADVAAGAGHAGVWTAVRVVRQRDGHAGRGRGDPISLGRGDPVARSVRPSPAVTAVASMG